jgi:hypothetical protein
MLSESPKYAQYEGDLPLDFVREVPPPPCDCTHRTPQGPPYGRTALLLKHALDLVDRQMERILGARQPCHTVSCLGESALWASGSPTAGSTSG